MKWASRQAVDVYFKAKSLFKLGARTIRIGEPVLIFDSVKTSTLNVGAQISYVTGGRGNNRLLSFEGDKSLTFNFEEALLSNEGLAILSGADLIPARNKHLKGSGAAARSIVTHYTEKYSVETANLADNDASNNYDIDATIPGIPRGGVCNVWLTKKPYVGQNGSIYIMLLDDAGEMSGAPIQVNLNTVGFEDATDWTASTTLAQNTKVKMTRADFTTASATAPTAAWTSACLVYITDEDVVIAVLSEADPAGTTFHYATSNIGGGIHHSFLGKFVSKDCFVAFGDDKLPIARANAGVAITGLGKDPENVDECGAFDDIVEYYVRVPGKTAADEPAWWQTSYGTFTDYVREIDATSYGKTWGDCGIDAGGTATTKVHYSYLLAPSGGIAQPVAYKEGTSFVYKVNVPSILYQDIVLCDYYVEYTHDATQVSILPDKFAPFMYVEGSTLVRRASDGVDLPAEFVIPKFKITTALTFTMQGTGDPSTFSFSGDAYPDFSKFDLTRKVLADIQILDADDNYDGAGTDNADPTSYRRFKYNNDSDGEYVWKDPSLEPHQNIDYSDIVVNAGQAVADPEQGGPSTRTPGSGQIDKKPLA